MDTKIIVLFERYEGVRFVLEQSLEKFQDKIKIISSKNKQKIISEITNHSVDLLITEISSIHPDGLEISAYARKHHPNLDIVWITVLGCDVYNEIQEKLGRIYCMEKPLDIKIFRNNILDNINQ